MLKYNYFIPVEADKAKMATSEEPGSGGVKSERTADAEQTSTKLDDETMDQSLPHR